MFLKFDIFFEMNPFEFEKNFVAYSLTLLKKWPFSGMNQLDFGKSIVACF